MASSRVMMSSSTTRQSDLTRRACASSSSSDHNQNLSQLKNSQNQSRFNSSTAMTVDGNVYSSNPSSDNNSNADTLNLAAPRKTVDDVWKEIVEGKKKVMKEETLDDSSEMMTLEDFLVKAGAVEASEDQDVKVQHQHLVNGGGIRAFDQVVGPAPRLFSAFEGSMNGFANGVRLIGSGGSIGRGKRGRMLMEPLDKAAQKRERRMIKNRESAARSRSRKQAYQVELEMQVVRLEEEHDQLMREKEERSKGRLKQLMEKVVPVVEQRRPPRPLRRVRSMQW